MKRVKLMLTAIAISAIAGGVFAFTTKFNRKVCTAVYDHGCPNSCPNLTQGHPHPIGTQYCYKVVAPNTTNCNTIQCETLPTSINPVE